MGQSDYIKEITRLALANDKNHLLETLYEFVDYSQKNNELNLQPNCNPLSKPRHEKKKSES